MGLLQILQYLPLNMVGAVKVKGMGSACLPGLHGTVNNIN